ncbi:MAG: anti-sigma factor, partial [Polaromonas sp.]|nr:anti-sigma factor [Polaromonas sp.]
ADGELRGAEFARALQACRDGGQQALVAWRSYHLIGDVLRSPAAPAHAAGTGFLQRLDARMAREQAAGELMPWTASPAAVGAAPATQAVVQVQPPASNDESFRWKLLAGAASLAAVSAIVWNACGFLAPVTAPQLSHAPVVQQQQVVVASPQGPVVRDARLEELLQAHRQLGGATALQAPSGFLRNAAFDTTQDGRR